MRMNREIVPQGPTALTPPHPGRCRSQNQESPPAHARRCTPRRVLKTRSIVGERRYSSRKRSMEYWTCYPTFHGEFPICSRALFILPNCFSAWANSGWLLCLEHARLEQPPWHGQRAAIWGGPLKHFDFQDPDDQARLSDPAFALRPLTGLVVLDEIQTRPDFFPLLRVLPDRPETPARILMLGSASPELTRRAAESLAGRVTFQQLGGLGLDELAAASGLGTIHPTWLDSHWLRGGFPRALLANDVPTRRDWRNAFIRTYVEHDLPQLGISLPALTLRRCEVIRRSGARRGGAHFCGVHTGTELDLLIPPDKACP